MLMPLLEDDTMTIIDVRRSVSIAAPADLVRHQFADVDHHAASDIHRGVRFEVLDDDGIRCHYRQVTHVGPIRLAQELTMERVDDGALVNTITRGQFEGGTITFDVQPDGSDRSRVEARLQADVAWLGTLAAPLMRRGVARAFDRALAEDREDLESGTYLEACVDTSDHS